MLGVAAYSGDIPFPTPRRLRGTDGGSVTGYDINHHTGKLPQPMDV